MHQLEASYGYLNKSAHKNAKIRIYGESEYDLIKFGLILDFS